MTNPAEKIPALAPGIQIFHRFVFLLFLLGCGLVLGLRVSGFSPATLHLGMALLLLSAVLTTLASFARFLPVQNVLTIAVLIAFVSSFIEILNLKTYFPFGHRVWTDNFGPQFFHVLPWPIPFIWIVILLNSRGFAAFLLRRSRSRPNYGLRALALTVLFAVILSGGLEQFAAANHLWFLPDSKTIRWYYFLSYALVSALILIVISPWLINKKPGPLFPPDYHPTIVSFLLLIMCALCK